MTRVAVECVQASKFYGSYGANKHIDIAIQEGSIHGIVGENGAGKSTLLSLIAGIQPLTSGSIYLSIARGRLERSRLHFGVETGVGYVPQNFPLISDMTVAENIVLGSRLPFCMQRRAIENAIEAWQGEHGFLFDGRKLVRTLSIGERQEVALGKCLYQNAEIILLDEPTAVLGPVETTALWGRLRTLREAGKTILVVSHKIRELLEICDRVSVLRAGQLVETLEPSQFDAMHIAHQMVGTSQIPMDTVAPVATSRAPSQQGMVALQDVHCSFPPPRIPLHIPHLEVGAGQIVGIAGVGGNGQDEFLDLLTGHFPQYEGTATLFNRPLSHFTPESIHTAGVGIIPPDREQAVVRSMSVQENLALGYAHSSAVNRWGFLRKKNLLHQSDRAISTWGIKPAHSKNLLGQYSGGNQQKWVFAREIQSHHRCLIAMHPTQGLDQKTSALFYQTCFQRRAEGWGILLFLSDIDEGFYLCDFLAVLFRGTLTEALPKTQVSKKQLGQWMGGL